MELDTERRIIDSILTAVAAAREERLPREAKGAAYWTAFYADRVPHEPPPLPLKPVTVWRYADGRYAGAAAPVRRRPWWERECIRWRPVIVPLQRLMKKVKED